MCIKAIMVCGERPLNDTALARDLLDKLDKTRYSNTERLPEQIDWSPRLQH